MRHFLRLLDAEGASGCGWGDPASRRHRNRKGAWSDTDELVMDPASRAFSPYRTLVLRRNHAAGRPPSPYERVWQGRYYEVWQRDPDYQASRLIVHHPLGGGFQPAVVPNCAVVQSVAAEAGQSGKVVAAIREPNAVANLTVYPPGLGS